MSLRIVLLIIGCLILGGKLAADTGALRPEIFIALPWNWTSHQAVVPVALTDGATVTPTGTDSNVYTLTLTGNNHTLAAPSTISYGVYAFRIKNNSGFTGFATASAYKYSGGNVPAWSTTSGAFDVITCQVFDTSRLECAALIDQR